MRVRAKVPANGADLHGVGYYDLRFFTGGEEFELSDPKHFSERWMEKVAVIPEPDLGSADEKEEPVSKKKKG
jgi:hypothetical protein